MERRLAAILAADVVGYSRLMAADEEATTQDYEIYYKKKAGGVWGEDQRLTDSPGNSTRSRPDETRGRERQGRRSGRSRDG